MILLSNHPSYVTSFSQTPLRRWEVRKTQSNTGKLKERTLMCEGFNQANANHSLNLSVHLPPLCASAILFGLLNTHLSRHLLFSDRNLFFHCWSVTLDLFLFLEIIEKSMKLSCTFPSCTLNLHQVQTSSPLLCYTWPNVIII